MIATTQVAISIPKVFDETNKLRKSFKFVSQLHTCVVEYHTCAYFQ